MDSSFMKHHKRSSEALHGWLIVLKTWQAMSRYLLSPLLAQGMGELDFRVLEILLHQGPMPVNAIGPQVYLNSGSISVEVDRLYKKGFVDRVECKEDRRSRTVSLTEKGRQVFTPVFRQHAAPHFYQCSGRHAGCRSREEDPPASEASLRLRVRRLIDAFNGPFGKIVAGLIAEGQSEPAIRQAFFDRWVSPRRTTTIADLQRGKNSGELRPDTEPEKLNDAIFDAIYYRFLLGSGPFTRRFGEELVEQVIGGQRAGNAPS